MPSFVLLNQNTTIMKLYTFAYVGRVHILYQVTDNHKITRQSTQNFHPGIHHPYLIWKRKIYVTTSKLVVEFISD